MRSVIITIVLGTALLLFAGVPVGSVLAMGAKNNAVQLPDNKTDESQRVRDQDKRTGDDISSKESNTHNKGKPSPTKKPRLKYRDVPGCSC
jgi:hypothetical protein